MPKLRLTLQRGPWPNQLPSASKSSIDRHILSNEGEFCRAKAMSNLEVSAGWCSVGR